MYPAGITQQQHTQVYGVAPPLGAGNYRSERRFGRGRVGRDREYLARPQRENHYQNIGERPRTNACPRVNRLIQSYKKE